MVRHAAADEDPFWGGSRTERILSQGRTFLPCHFYEVHYLVALFRTTEQQVLPFLEGSGLKPGLRWTGRPVVALGLIQYRRSDLGAYQEIILSVPSVPEGSGLRFGGWGGLFGDLDKRQLGQYILQIPVTSQFSVEAGREIWGYPKRMAKIDHQFLKGELKSEMREESDQLVLQCRGKLGFSVPFFPLSLVTYSFKNGHPLRTPVAVKGWMRWFPAQKLALKAGASQDSLAMLIRDLGLDGKSPFLVMDSPGFQSKFFPGKEVGPAWVS
jgi:hypothetical protein